MSGLSLRCKPRLYLGLRCSVCQQIDGHADGCLQFQLDQLQARIRHIECPKCGKGEVDINGEDFFECRSCHARYSSSNWNPGGEKFILNDPLSDDLVVVVILEGKGNGDFPLDKTVAEVSKKIRLSKKSGGRKKS